MPKYYDVSAQCVICGKWYSTRCTWSGKLSRHTCGKAACIAKHYWRGNQHTKPNAVNTEQVNGCTLKETRFPKRCKDWIEGRCSEEKYLECLDAAARNNWQGWTRVNGKRDTPICDNENHGIFVVQIDT